MFTPDTYTALVAANLNEPSPPPVPFPSTQQQLWRLACVAELLEKQAKEQTTQQMIEALYRSASGYVPVTWLHRQRGISVGVVRRQWPPQRPSASR